MKKFLFSLMAIVLVSVSSFAKVDNVFTEERKINSSELSKNPNFIKLANEIYDFNNFLTKKIKENSLSIEEINRELSNIQKLDYEKQLEQINILFKSNVSDRLVEHMNIFSSNWRTLKRDFSHIEDDVKVIEDALLEAINNNTVTVSANAGCGWRYNLCIVAAGAGAVLCHAACDTTALATTAGLGIPACILACGTLQVYASVQCIDNYC